jgi:hypothetical protein
MSTSDCSSREGQDKHNPLTIAVANIFSIEIVKAFDKERVGQLKLQSLAFL